MKLEISMDQWLNLEPEDHEAFGEAMASLNKDLFATLVDFITAEDGNNPLQDWLKEKDLSHIVADILQPYKDEGLATYDKLVIFWVEDRAAVGAIHEWQRTESRGKCPVCSKEIFSGHGSGGIFITVCDCERRREGEGMPVDPNDDQHLEELSGDEPPDDLELDDK